MGGRQLRRTHSRKRKRPRPHSAQSTVQDISTPTPPAPNHYNLGDSIGLLALIFAAVAVAINPPIWVKTSLLLPSCVGFFSFSTNPIGRTAGQSG